jgi:hypothetical protein
MAVWLVRAGRNGEQQEAALENGIRSINKQIFVITF